MSASRTIVVADETRAAADVLCGLLPRRGWHIVHTPNGKTALTVARACRPALIIADVTLPVASGLELVRALRHDPDLKDTPVIFWSAFYEPQQIRTFATGCEPFTAYGKTDDLAGLVPIIRGLVPRDAT